MNICYDNYYKLAFKWMIVFHVSLNFNPVKKMLKIPHLYFNEQSDYSEENTCDNEVFRSTILYQRKKLYIFTLQLPIYYNSVITTKILCREPYIISLITYSIRIGNIDLCKCGHCKNEAGGIDCMVTGSAKILERKGSISPFTFYGHLPDY